MSRIHPLDISPCAEQRRLKQFPREGQELRPREGQLPAQSHTALGLQESRAPTDQSSNVREATPAPVLTPGCLLLLISQEKNKNMAGSIHHRLSNWAGGAGVSREVTSRSLWGPGSGGAGGERLEFFPPWYFPASTQEGALDAAGPAPNLLPLLTQLPG